MRLPHVSAQAGSWESVTENARSPMVIGLEQGTACKGSLEDFKVMILNEWGQQPHNVICAQNVLCFKSYYKNLKSRKLIKDRLKFLGFSRPGTELI